MHAQTLVAMKLRIAPARMDITGTQEGSVRCQSQDFLVMVVTNIRVVQTRIQMQEVPWRMNACAWRVFTGLPANQKEIARPVRQGPGVLDPVPITWNVTNVRQTLILQPKVKVKRTVSVMKHTMDPTVDSAKVAHRISTVQGGLIRMNVLRILALHHTVTRRQTASVMVVTGAQQVAHARCARMTPFAVVVNMTPVLYTPSRILEATISQIAAASRVILGRTVERVNCAQKIHSVPGVHRLRIAQLIPRR
jgi:hypothetical protein